MKKALSPYIWSSTPPHRVGMWWYRIGEDYEPEILRVFKVEGEVELSYQWGVEEEDVDFVINAHGAFWAGPIPEPRASPETESASSQQCI